MSTTVFFLLISLSSSPSDPSIPDFHQLPVQNDEAAREDLAGWVVGRPERTAGLQVMSRGDLEAATSSQPRHFDLFGSDLESQAERRFLSGLPYGSVLSLAADRHRVDGLLLAAIIEAESGFRPHRVSPRGAVGLMQVLPATAKAYGSGDLLDPHVNVDVGSRYLAYLLETHDNLEATLAAYNAGPAAVQRYGGVPPFRETRAYVKKVKSRYEEYRRQARQQPAGFDRLVASRVGAGT